MFATWSLEFIVKVAAWVMGILGVYKALVAYFTSKNMRTGLQDIRRIQEMLHQQKDNHEPSTGSATRQTNHRRAPSKGRVRTFKLSTPPRSTE